MLHSLRPRLLLAILFVIAVALGSVALIGRRATSSEFQRYIDTESTQRGRAMAELLIYYRQNRSWANVEPLLRQMGQISGDRIILTDSEGRIIADSMRESGGDENMERIRSLLLEDDTDSYFGRPTVLIDSDSGPQVLVYIASGGGQEESPGTIFLGSVNRQLAIAIVGAGLVGLILMAIFSRRILKPVEALTEAARKMERGDLHQRVDVHSRDEIGELAHAFNAMADGLSRQEQLRRNMVSDVAHELRTPISNLRGYLEAVHDGVIEPTPELFESLHEETMVLIHLMDDLQDLAQAEAGQLKLQRRPMDLAEVVQRVVAQLQPKAKEKRLTIHIQIPQDLPLVDIDDERIGQVLRNILSNAIGYTLEGGGISLEARERDAMVEVTVSDTGIGIEPEHLPHIFDRFYRSDSSRARATGGTGLGLAIAKQWVEAHDGAISVDSVVDQGTTITIALPAASSSKPSLAASPASEAPVRMLGSVQ